MKVMSSREAQNAFGAFLDTAQREPVMVTRRSRPVGVMFSLENLPALLEFADTMKQEIKAGVESGVADAEAGRMRELTLEYIEELAEKAKKRVRSKKAPA